MPAVSLERRSASFKSNLQVAQRKTTEFVEISLISPVYFAGVRLQSGLGQISRGSWSITDPHVSLLSLSVFTSTLKPRPGLCNLITLTEPEPRLFYPSLTNYRNVCGSQFKPRLWVRSTAHDRGGAVVCVNTPFALLRTEETRRKKVHWGWALYFFFYPFGVLGPGGELMSRGGRGWNVEY